MFAPKIFEKYCSEEWFLIFETHRKTLEVEKKEIIFSEGDPVEGLFFIESGNVKVLSRFHQNENKIIRLASTGTLLGHCGIRTDTYPVTAVALTPVILTVVPISVFVKILKANPNLALFLIEFMADEIRDAEVRVNNLLVLDPRQRVASVLLHIIHCFGYDKHETQKLSFTLPRADMANMAGTTYETIIRTLSLFEKEKIIKLLGKEICILSEKKLQQMARKKQPAA